MVPEPHTSRRRLLATAAIGLTGAAAGCTQGESAPSSESNDTTTAPPTESPTTTEAETEMEGQTVPYFGGWMANVENYDYTLADRTDTDEVVVTVGTQGNGGAFGFEPPALRVDPGATVRWKWTGNGGGHNVVAEDDSFDSGDIRADPGVHFGHTFEETGVHRYSCRPHEALGMKGVVVVGDEYPTKPASRIEAGEASTEQSARHDHPEKTDDESDSTGPYGGYLDGTESFDGTPADRTDTDEVVVTVGAQGNGGAFSFHPAAIRVRPGTTVRWRWTGNGGSHNVVAEDDSFDSGEVQREPGVHFEHTFEDAGIHRYYCAPHKALGMRGVVEVVEA